MATSVEFDCVAGVSPTLRLFAWGTDTLSKSASGTERDNDSGSYVATITGLATGIYRACVQVSGATVFRGVLDHVDGATMEFVGIDRSAMAPQIFDDEESSIVDAAWAVDDRPATSVTMPVE